MIPKVNPKYFYVHGHANKGKWDFIGSIYYRDNFLSSARGKRDVRYEHMKYPDVFKLMVYLLTIAKR